MLLRSSCQSWMTGRHQNKFLLSRSSVRRFCCSDPWWRRARSADLRQIAPEGQGLRELLRDDNGVWRCLSNARMQEHWAHFLT